MRVKVSLLLRDLQRCKDDRPYKRYSHAADYACYPFQDATHGLKTLLEAGDAHNDILAILKMPFYPLL